MAAEVEALAPAAEAPEEQGPDEPEDSLSLGPLRQHGLRIANQELRRQLTIDLTRILILTLTLTPIQP